MERVWRHLADPAWPGCILVGPPGVGTTSLARQIVDGAGARERTPTWLRVAPGTARVPLGGLAPLIGGWHDGALSGRSLRQFADALTAVDGVVLVVDDVHHLDEVSTAVLLQVLHRGRVQLVATAKPGALARPGPAASLLRAGLERWEVGPLSPWDSARLHRRLSGLTEGPGDDRWAADAHRDSGGRPALLQALAGRYGEAGAVSLVGAWLADLTPGGARAARLLAAAGGRLPADVVVAEVDGDAVVELERHGLARGLRSGRRTELVLDPPLLAGLLWRGLGLVEQRVTAQRLAGVLARGPTRRADDARIAVELAIRGGPAPPDDLLERAAEAAVGAGDAVLAGAVEALYRQSGTGVSTGVAGRPAGSSFPAHAAGSGAECPGSVLAVDRTGAAGSGDPGPTGWTGPTGPTGGGGSGPPGTSEVTGFAVPGGTGQVATPPDPGMGAPAPRRPVRSTGPAVEPSGPEPAGPGGVSGSEFLVAGGGGTDRGGSDGRGGEAASGGAFGDRLAGLELVRLRDEVLVGGDEGRLAAAVALAAADGTLAPRHRLLARILRCELDAGREPAGRVLPVALAVREDARLAGASAPSLDPLIEQLSAVTGRTATWQRPAPPVHDTTDRNRDLTAVRHGLATLVRRLTLVGVADPVSSRPDHPLRPVELVGSLLAAANGDLGPADRVLRNETAGPGGGGGPAGPAWLVGIGDALAGLLAAEMGRPLAPPRRPTPWFRCEGIWSVTDTWLDYRSGPSRATAGSGPGDAARAERVRRRVEPWCGADGEPALALLALIVACRFDRVEPLVDLVAPVVELIGGPVGAAVGAAAGALAAADAAGLATAGEALVALGLRPFGAECLDAAAARAATGGDEAGATRLRFRRDLILAVARSPVLGAVAPVLSRRESEIVAALGPDRSNRDIAERLFVSRRTVENHLGRIYRRLGVSGREELLTLTRGGLVVG